MVIPVFVVIVMKKHTLWNVVNDDSCCERNVWWRSRWYRKQLKQQMWWMMNATLVFLFLVVHHERQITDDHWVIMIHKPSSLIWENRQNGKHQDFEDDNNIDNHDAFSKFAPSLPFLVKSHGGMKLVLKRVLQAVNGIDIHSQQRRCSWGNRCGIDISTFIHIYIMAYLLVSQIGHEISTSIYPDEFRPYDGWIPSRCQDGDGSVSREEFQRALQSGLGDLRYGWRLPKPICLVLFLEHDWIIFPYDLGISSSQLTNSYFSEG